MNRHLTGNSLPTVGNVKLATVLTIAALGISACGKDAAPVETIKTVTIPENILTSPNTGGTPYISNPTSVNR